MQLRDVATREIAGWLLAVERDFGRDSPTARVLKRELERRDRALRQQAGKQTAGANR